MNDVTDYPEYLYHYCSCDAFKSIIEHKTIRLSALDQSNDFTEGLIIAEAFKKHMLSIFMEKKSKVIIANNNEVEKNIDDVVGYWRGFGFCLTESRDSLSQWRGYAQEATGFAIGFRVEELRRLFDEANHKNSSYGSAQLRKVIYKEELNEELIMKANDVAAKIEAASKLSADEHTDEVIAPLLQDFAYLSRDRYCFKKQGFQDEREWRVLASVRGSDHKKLNFLHSNGQIKPYIDVSFGDFPKIIGEVVVGPKQSTPDLIIDALVKKAGFEVEVIKSKTSFR